MKTTKVSVPNLSSVKATVGAFKLMLQDSRIPIEIREEYVDRFYKLKEQFEFDKEMDRLNGR